MNKKLIILLALLAVSVIAHAQDSDYQSLVREGVRWVNVYCMTYEPNRVDKRFYRYEFCGDTVVDGREYKKCYYYTGQELNPNTDLVYCIMREEGHRVFVIVLDECVMYYPTEFYMDEQGNSVDFLDPNACEALLFDFDDPESRFTEAFHYGPSLFKNGIGFVSSMNGDSFHPYTAIPTNDEYDETYCLSHLEDLQGNIIYRNSLIYSGIDDVSADAQAVKADSHWYNLMGQSFDSEPMQPGIYIHQGKKVVVK